VTGSAGKTSVKEMLRTALAATGAVHAADKSFNNHWGVPLTLARLPMRSDFAVIEIGMNHAGEITPLTRLVRPHAAIVTTVAAAHLEFFGTVEKIAEAKAEIFLGIEQDGAAILPRDNDHYALLKRRAEEAGVRRFITFGRHEDADLRLQDYSQKGETGAIKATVFGRPIAYALGAPGLHQAVNSLAVIAAVLAIGEPEGRAVAALADYQPAEGRGLRKEIAMPDGGRAMLIDESYNANPASMAAALALLGSAKPRGKGRRIAVLGEMLELGPDGPMLHAGLADHLKAAKVDRLYLAGELMRHLWGKAPEAMRARSAKNAAGLVEAVKSDLRDGDIVMVKGSNASKVSLVARALENDMSGETPRSAGAEKG
jgi:UDP-N-acetylmuramoyl-tripeptide--D-alanyl-D-alanine ligase